MLTPSACADFTSSSTTGRPSQRIVPSSAARAPERIAISVDLPAPFSPATAWTSPAASAIDTSCSAAWGPKRLVSDRTSRSGGTGVMGDGVYNPFPMRVRFDKVSKRFGAHSALREVDLEVEPGECLVLLGPSGCGKTTLLRLLAGLETQDAGRLWIGDREVTALDPAERDVAMVFQNYALYPHMTVY